MENGLKALYIATAVIVTIMLIGMIFFIARLGSDSQDSANNDVVQEFSNVNSRIEDTIDKTTVTGNEVRYYVSKYSSNPDFSIKVTTKKSPGGFYDFNGINNQNSRHYVNPKHRFVVVSQRNNEGNLVGYSFTEEGVRDTNFHLGGSGDEMSYQEMLKLLAKLKDENARLPGMIEEAKANLEELEAQLVTLKQKITELSEKLNDLNGDYSALESEKARLDAEIADWIKKINDILAQM